MTTDRPMAVAVATCEHCSWSEQASAPAHDIDAQLAVSRVLRAALLEHVRAAHGLNPEPFPDRLSDIEAMNQIHAVLSGQLWDADTVDRVADIVRQTGRAVKGFEP